MGRQAYQGTVGVRGSRGQVEGWKRWPCADDRAQGKLLSPEGFHVDFV
jgi:hypothetical protein